MSAEQLKTRDQIDPQDTWDLMPMFESDEAWQEAYESAAPKIAHLEALAGTLSQSGEHLAQAIDQILEVSRFVVQIYVYAHLKNDQDQSNATYQSMDAQAVQLYSQLNQALAFFEPELLAIPQAQLETFIQETPALELYQQYLDNTTRYRPHVLSEAEEQLLAQGSEIFGAPSRTFGVLNNADLAFPHVTDDQGQPVQLTHSVYGKMLESTDRRVRQETFEEFYSVYDQFKNTFASVLGTSVKTNNFHAKVRGFDSARQRALFTNNIPEQVFDTLVDVVNDHLELLHRYVALRQELLGLEDLEMYDMYTPLLGEAPIKFTYEEAKAITLEALAPLGEDYVAIIQKAFDERWIDLYENAGKRSGAYSSGTYDSNPYILMNWQDNVNWLYTLVHELGHSAHSYLTHQHQPYVYGNYSIFLAEIASTTNENLLTTYLLNKYEDPENRLYILNHFLDGVKGTVFRQTQFAEFEHWMHTSDAAGQPLTQEVLSIEYQALNQRYYGEEVNSDSQIALEWARIPHFYMNYYVFQYATGFAAAAFFEKGISSGCEMTVENYLGFLKSGSKNYPIDTMKATGLDMTQKTYLLETMDLFEERLNEFEHLVAQRF